MNRVQNYEDVLRRIRKEEGFSDLMRSLDEVRKVTEEGQKKESFKLPFSSEPEYHGPMWR